jgi:hypothetical protein
LALYQTNETEEEKKNSPEIFYQFINTAVILVIIGRAGRLKEIFFNIFGNSEIKEIHFFLNHF